MRSPTHEEAAVVVSLGDWLRSLRLARGMSQERVAQDAGIDVATYGRIERAVCGGMWANPRLQTTMKLLRVLKVSGDELHEFLVSGQLEKPQQRT